MKKLATLALSVILITGCNAMKPNMEETKLLSKEIEKRIYAQIGPTKAPEPVEAPAESKEIAPAPAPIIVSEQEDEPRPVPSEPAEEPQSAAPEPAEESEATPRWQAEPAEIIVWPYPRITCPPEPTPTPEPEWPQITCPPEPLTYTPEPEPNEPPQEEPTPTSQLTPAAPADPVDPIPEPTEQPANPTSEPTTEQPSIGYAQCSCGARLTPEELVPHMKAHAMNGENHSYRAY